MSGQLPPFNPNPESPTDQYFRQQLEREKLLSTLFLIVMSCGSVFACVMFCLPLLLFIGVLGGFASLLPAWTDQFLNPNLHWPP